MSRTVISIKDLTLDFPVRNVRGLKGLLTGAKQAVGTKVVSRNNRHFINVFDSLNLEVEAGQCIGILGHNGAGKSTLLKLVAGIYPPTAGTCEVSGRISTLFTNAVGMHPDLSGYDNIFRGALAIGLSKSQVEEKIEDIKEFCELGDFIHMPLRTYSQGMKTRISFAIATTLNPDILLVDEILGAGDARFLKKARQRISDTIKTANAVLLASHSLGTLQRLCNRGLWIHHGAIRMDGPIRTVTRAYRRSMR